MTELTPIRKVLLATPQGKLSYPDLLEPREREYPDGSTRSLYSTNLLLPPDAKKTSAWELISNTILKYAVHELGAKSVATKKNGAIEPKFKTPGIKDPDGKIEGHEDWWPLYASTGADFPPMLLNSNGHEIDPDESDRLIFPGADASVIFGLYFYNNPAYAGCSFQLNAVYLMGTGEPFKFDSQPSREERHAAITAAVVASGGSMAALEDKVSPSTRARVVEAFDSAPALDTISGADPDDDIPF